LILDKTGYEQKSGEKTNVFAGLSCTHHNPVDHCEAANRLIDVLLVLGDLVSAAIAAAGEVGALEMELELGELQELRRAVLVSSRRSWRTV
jgi:hypothetical protein